mmetsp:Transcript_3839/g.6913  ORF Transcript_3839/g.6913 Transcript_3839/m.6913 type:complete len:81 (-) Transcript_3839:114-356(-)
MARYLPEMKKLMDRQISVGLNGNRQVEGVLRGYDQFMNIVLENAVSLETTGSTTNQVPMGTVVLRGNSIVVMDVKERTSS